MSQGTFSAGMFPAGAFPSGEFPGWQGPVIASGGSTVTPGPGNSPPKFATYFATDEDVYSLCPGDFGEILPRDIVVASGDDGVIAQGNPWVLTSASVDFAGQGVKANHVVLLTCSDDTVFGPSGTYFAVDSAATTSPGISGSITLRRAGQYLGFGQPPIPASGFQSAITFRIATMANILEEVGYWIRLHYAIDDNIINRRIIDLYDFRTFRRANVYKCVLNLYINLSRSKEGDWDKKIARYANMFEEDISQTAVRWGPTGQQQSPSTPAMKIAR